MQNKDTFLSILDRLSPNQVPKLRLVCKNWRRWIDAAPLAWEAQEPFETAKHWRIKLGHPLKGEKYAMLYQIGKTPWPGQCTMLCVRECDQVIEVKSIDTQGQGTLVKELTGIPGKVTAIRQLQHSRFAVGYDNGHVLIWNITRLDFPAMNISAFETAVLQLSNVSVLKKNIDHSGIMTTTEDDLLLVSDNQGHLKCFDLRDATLRWEATPNFPVMDMRKNDDNTIEVVCFQTTSKNNRFFIKYFFCENGSELQKQKEIIRPYATNDEIKNLKRAKLYPNHDVVDFVLSNTPTNQHVTINTYSTNPKTEEVTTRFGQFFKRQIIGVDYTWLWSQAYILEDTFAYASYGKDSQGEASIAYPRRLPITQVSLLEDENVSKTLTK